jgi:tumor protein p53-inducible protein 3
MKIITQKNVGGPEELVLGEGDKPTPGADDLLVRVKASGLNRADLLQRRGKYPPPAGASPVLGMEIAGEIVSMGSNVSGFQTGDKVFGLVPGGGYAEYCLLDQGMAMPIPNNLSYIEAAGIAEAFLTAQEAVFTLGQLQAHESILIHAGGSGVGIAAMQLASQVNATIYTTVGSDEKAERIKSFGATAIINYRQQDFAAEILKLTTGVDVIIDFIGAKYLSLHCQILQRQGRLINVGMMGGSKAEIDLEILRAKMLQLKGLAMRTSSLAEKRKLTAHFKQHWLPLFSSKKLKPVIDSIFSFADAHAAHTYMENNLNVGKIILNLE